MNEFQCLTLAAIYLSGSQHFDMEDFEVDDIHRLYKAALTIKKLENEYLREFKTIEQFSQA